MPGQIVLVHSSAGFAHEAGSALRHSGYEVAVFTDPMLALDALDRAKTVELLITRVSYPAGKPNGVALALMARHRRPNIRIVFTACADMRPYAEGIGEFLPAPVAIPDLVAVIRGLFPRPAPPQGAIGNIIPVPPLSNTMERPRAFSWPTRRLLQLAARTIARTRQLRDRTAELQSAAAHRYELTRAGRGK